MRGASDESPAALDLAELRSTSGRPELNRSGVERQLILVGEAVNSLLRDEPDGRSVRRRRDVMRVLVRTSGLSAGVQGIVASYPIGGTLT